MSGSQANSYEVLKTAKSALDEGLINQADYDEVKNSFLRAQQIKAGLDAGFIKEAEFTHVKRAFLNSLNLHTTPEKAGAEGPLGGPSSNGVSQAAASQPVSHRVPRSPSPAAERESRAFAAEPRPSRPDRPTAPGPRASTAGPPPPSSAARSQPTGTSSPSRQREELAPGVNVPRNIPNVGGRRPQHNTGVSMSGICVSEDAINLYYLLKTKTKYRWATWMINAAGSEVVIANVGESTSDYSEFLSALPSADCRYGVYDYQFTNSEGCVFNKLAFVNWAPDAAKVKAKMMYASTKDHLKRFLDGLATELQANDKADIQERDLAEAVRSTITRQ